MGRGRAWRGYTNFLVHGMKTSTIMAVRWGQNCLLCHLHLLDSLLNYITKEFYFNDSFIII